MVIALWTTLVNAGLMETSQARAQTSPTPQTDQTKSGNDAKPDKRIKRNYGFYEPEPLDFNDHTGYVEIFDGKTLKEWDGDPDIWRVENGAIIGESTVEKPKHNSYISYHGVQAKDFDLKLEIKVEHGGGSGIQYRSQTKVPWQRPLPPGQKSVNLDWMMTGPQADFWFPVSPITAEWTGQFYSENTSLGILTWRGQLVESSAGQHPKLLANIADRNALGGYVRVNDWNQYFIMARGGTFIHVINGQLMAVYVDDDSDSSNNKSGMIGIEIEGTPTRVSVRNLWIKKLN
jgi:3-keto-disaccharide hydrolase